MTRNRPLQITPAKSRLPAVSVQKRSGKWYGIARPPGTITAFVSPPFNHKENAVTWARKVVRKGGV